jgi:hypothetical protein
MKQRIQIVAGLLTLFALQACSEKTVTAPAVKVVPVAAATPVAVAAPAPKVPVSFKRRANLQCGERKITVTATCVNIWDSGTLACTSTRLAVSESFGDKELNVREFKAGKPDGDDPGLVEGAFNDISCVTAKSNEKYIVAYMTRQGGGNCEECEWADVYSWDGVLLGNERKAIDPAKTAAIAEASSAAFDPKTPAMAKISLEDFYTDPGVQ